MHKSGCLADGNLAFSYSLFEHQVTERGEVRTLSSVNTVASNLVAEWETCLCRGQAGFAWHGYLLILI